MEAARRRLRRVLPTGRTLSETNWESRHRWITALVWLHLPVLAVYGVVRAEPHAIPVEYLVLEVAIVAVLALAAGSGRFGRRTREALATLGLVTCSAVLVHLSGGLIEMHFHFFVVIILISLYQSWLPFLLAVGYVVVHHGVVGVVAPEAVYNHPAAIANPWGFAVLHGAFILAASAASLVAWRLSEVALESERVARARLERANEDLAAAQALSNLGSWEWIPATGEVWWSDELARIYGLDPGSFRPSFAQFLEHIHPDDVARVSAAVEVALRGDDQLDLECRIIRVSGEERSVHLLGQLAEVRDDGARLLRGTCQDVTERRELERQAEYRAFHDELTGLGNRALFLDRLEHALDVRARSDDPLSVLYIDIDDFKTINDSLGHASGDQLLVEVAGRLEATIRPADTVARMGGDEFAVLLEGADEEAATQIATRISEVIATPLVLAAKQLQVRSSVGIAVLDGRVTATDLLRDADVAMYAAKRSGRDWAVFHDGMLDDVVRRMELQSDLREALEAGQFHLVFQPVVELETGRVDGLEALVRWEHPERGSVPADEFVPLAEETGLILPIGGWVLAEATRLVAALREATGIRSVVAVNLAPQQLTTGILETVRTALRASGLTPSDLVLEVTERTLMRDEDAVERLRQLRDLGVHISVDDFGTGYSSLGYIQRLPIDILKIDRSFVERIDDGVEEAALARAILKLGATFDLAVVAEGIERHEQIEVLRRHGCELGQGYHICPPLPIEQFEQMFAGSDRIDVLVGSTASAPAPSERAEAG